MKTKLFIVLSVALLVALTYLVMTGGKTRLDAPVVVSEPSAQSTTHVAAQPDYPNTREILSYVPADTLFFSGGLDASPLFSLFQGVLSAKDLDDLTQLVYRLQDELNAELDAAEEDVDNQLPKSSAINFVVGAMIEYLRLEHEPKRLAQAIGISSQVIGATYAIDTIPVLRVQLENEDAFLQFIESIDATGKTHAEKVHINGLDFKKYELGLTGDELTFANYRFYVTVHQGYALFIVATQEQLIANFDLLVGNDKPQASLANSGKLEQIQMQYKFDPRFMMFAEVEKIFAALMQPNTPVDPMLYLYASMSSQGGLLDVLNMTRLMAEDVQDVGMESFLVKLKAPGCQEDIGRFVNFSPRSLLGYTSVNIEQMPIGMVMRTVNEINQPLLADLTSLRGFSPRVLTEIDSQVMFGVGLAVDVSAAVPLVSRLVQTIAQEQFSCELMLNMQAVVREYSSQILMGSAALSGMVTGIQGVSFVINDLSTEFNPDNNQLELTHLDGFVAVSASSPVTLVMMASGLLDDMAGVTIPLDGSVTELALPLPWPMEERPKVAVKGSHLVLYMGDVAARQVDDLAGEVLVDNAVLSMKFDTQAIMKKIGVALQQDVSALASENAEELAALKRVMAMLQKFDLKLTYLYDVVDVGAQSDTAFTYNVVH